MPPYTRASRHASPKPRRSPSLSPSPRKRRLSNASTRQNGISHKGEAGQYDAIIHNALLTIFLGSTPAVCIAVFGFDGDREWWTVVNSYCFSVAMDLLYLWPLVSPLSGQAFTERLHDATMNWVLWMSCFTQVAFQVPHNLLVPQLRAAKGTLPEWPFFSYGLSDGRWSDYGAEEEGAALAPAVWLINVNDAALGLVVLGAFVMQRQQQQQQQLQQLQQQQQQQERRAACNWSLVFVLALVFRDATLWRETVEYMWDHHKAGYPHTASALALKDPSLRPHLIAILWTVNGVWLVAPLLTAVWAYQQLRARDLPS